MVIMILVGEVIGAAVNKPGDSADTLKLPDFIGAAQVNRSMAT